MSLLQTFAPGVAIFLLSKRVWPTTVMHDSGNVLIQIPIPGLL